MLESVRLVVWDLDETYWRGTFTEGGIREYVQDHHDIVVELAKRGIMSSICSKNDKEQILNLLRQYEILDYFIFPSISWGPKGQRLAGLIETVQLRPSTVLFIDDNPNNRAEAIALVPDLQVEDETFIPKILTDARFKGKNDPDLSRLKQYKLLEERKNDENTTLDSNEDFLRGCDVRVYIEYDIASNVDRVVELINRTNQLNYTKKRLPEDMATARGIVLAEIDHFNRQAGLVRVIDKYGDYGFVGYFEMINGRQNQSKDAVDSKLQHFCFSCRTLGMFVEQWVYEYLRRPELLVVGDVLTDLSVPRAIDWIRLVPKMEQAARAVAPLASEILVTGGCEANAIGVYLAARTPGLTVLGNFMANGVFVHLNSAALMMDLCRRTVDEFTGEADRLGLPVDLMAGDMIGDRQPGCAYIINVSRDSEPQAVYRHKKHGWKLWIQVWGLEGILYSDSEDDQLRRIEKFGHHEEMPQERLAALMRHLREHYELGQILEDDGVRAVHDLIDRIPTGSKLVIAVNHHEQRGEDGVIVTYPRVETYTRRMRELSERFPYVGVVSFTEVITSKDEIQVGVNHYQRQVFLRFADRAAEVLESLRSKP